MRRIGKRDGVFFSNQRPVNAQDDPVRQAIVGYCHTSVATSWGLLVP